MKIISALACSALLIGGAAFAADTTPAPAPAAAPAKAAPDQCSKDAKAKGLHGKARKSFLKTCRASATSK